MATVNLGNIKFNWKGTYNAGTAYAVDDVVSYNGSSYVCISATTGNLPTVTAKWNVMATAGTNGTDVGTTITTQGDLLYRDGSGLQRLAKGTASQVLKMNTSANAPEWGNLSSDYVKIAETTLGSDAASMVIDNCFTSDYDIYDIEILKYKSSGSSSASQFRGIFRSGGASGSDQSDSFKNMMRYEYNQFSSSGQSGTGSGQYVSQMQFFNGWHSPSNSYQQASFRMHHVNGELPMLTGLSQGRQGGTGDTHYIQMSAIMSNTAINKGTNTTGFKLFAQSANIKAGCTVKIYGIK